MLQGGYTTASISHERRTLYVLISHTGFHYLQRAKVGYRVGTVRRELWTSIRNTKYVQASLGFRVLLGSNHLTRLSASPVPL